MTGGSDGALVVVTGASGFIGSALCEALVRHGHRVRRAVRTPTHATSDEVALGDYGAGTDWRQALAGADCVVHLAARTHVVEKEAAGRLAEYRRVNVEATRKLATDALAAGVRRLIFLSSTKVNGEESAAGSAFREGDPPQPQDAYGVTKREAEDALLALSGSTPLEAVIVRPPLVYGPGVKGNFLRLMRLVARGLPLPFGAIENRRSLIYVGNLVHAIRACIAAPQAARRTFLVSDGEDFSTPQLIVALARALERRPRLVNCPRPLLESVAALAGKSADIARLTRSLQVDSGLIRRELGWSPPYTAAQGLAETARWYHAHVDHRARAE